jgi:aspartate oxidase
LITEAALYRKESRGGHRREDFPSKKSKYVADTIQHRDKKNKYVPIKNLLFYE